MRDLSAGIKSLGSRDGLCLAFFLIAYRALYLLAYPFIVEGDGANYYGMLLRGESSLIHAPGYPFLMSAFLPIQGVLFGAPAHTLRVIQQLIPVASVCVLYACLREEMSKRVAFVLCLVIGSSFLSVSMAGTSRPEFLQESLAILALALAVRSMRTPSLFILVSLGLVFGFAYLTKYNSVVLFPLILLPATAAGSILSRAVRPLFSLVSAGIVILIFVELFHLPKTGTRKLNLEHGMIHTKKLIGAGMGPDPTVGSNTKRFLILANELPSMHDYGLIWRHVNIIDPNVRKEPIAYWGELRRMSESQLSELASNYSGYQLGVPDIFKTYYYLGLENTEALLFDVFKEHLAAKPSLYLRDMLNTFFVGFHFHEIYQPIVPVFDRGGVSNRVLEKGFVGGATKSRMVPREAISDCVTGGCFGVKAFDSSLAHVLSLSGLPHLLHSYFYWLLCLIAISILALRRFRALSPKERLSLCSFTIVLLQLCFSAIVYRFREKELLLISPFLVVSLILFCGILAESLKSYFKGPVLRTAHSST